MIVLEDQVISLEIAEKLRKLGVKEDSLFYWAYADDDKQWELVFGMDLEEYADDFPYQSMNIIPAYNVAELGDLMKGKGMGTTAYSDIQKQWWVSGGKWDVTNQKYSEVKMDLNEANARAQMLVYLLENKLI